MKYRYSEGDFTQDLDATTLQDALIEAKELLLDGDWDPGPVSACVYVLEEDADGEEVHVSTETVSAVIEPPEPTCLDNDDHDWQSPHALVGGVKENPGVWSHGDGIRMTEVCAACGIYRETDTAAQDLTDGTTYRKVSYREADDASLAWVEENNI